MQAPRDRVAGLLVGVLEAVLRHPGAVAGACLLLTAGLGFYAATHLGVDTDNRRALLADDLPSEAHARAFEQRFDGLSDALLVVIDAPSAPAARSAARALIGALDARPDAVRTTDAPAASPFFERNALLYLELADLEEFSDEIVRMQPFLAAMDRSPDLATLAELMAWGLDPPEGTPQLGPDLPTLLDRMGQSVAAVEAGQAVRVRWADLLAGGFSFGAPRQQTVIVQPVLQTDRILPAAVAIDAIRDAAHELGLDRDGHRVRITGYPALNHEEMMGLLWDVGIAGLASFALVLGVLTLAMRSAPLVISAAATLVAGLIWTAALAAATVGAVNLVSITFAVLFLGLGVDFAIHFGMHYAAERRAGRSHGEAVLDVGRVVGPSMALCTASTAIGFLSFLPTDFKGVAELGLISGLGMVVIFVLSFTLFPALFTAVLPVRKLPPEVRIPFEPRSDSRHPRRVGAIALATALVAAAVGLGVRFDANVVTMRNPNTESVRTWNDLLESGSASPWYANATAQGLDEAEALGNRLLALPEVARVTTPRDLVPEDQEVKQEILADLAFLLEGPGGTATRQESDPRKGLRALARLRDELGAAALAEGPRSLRKAAERLDGHLARFLERARTERDPEALVSELEAALLGDMPAQIAHLRASLEPDEVTLETVPAAVRSRMIAPDGTTRVQIHPAEDLNAEGNLDLFVAAVRSIDPTAVGLPVNVVAVGEVTARSLREALLLAIGAIGALLLLLGQRPIDTALTLAPLLLGAAWTVGAMTLFGISFNFANVIVLPLLLGTGVDSGIHLVARAQRSQDDATPLAATTTGRAVFFSAITTLASFGTLASSAHRGIASLGVVLVLGMALTLTANLGVLPSLLSMRRRRSARATPSRG